MARADFALLEDISQRLTCGPDTIHAGITRILNERNAASRFGQRYLAESAALQAQVLLAKERAQHAADPPRIVTGILADADMEYLRTVATNIISEPGVVALLGSETNGSIVMAKSEGVCGRHERVVARSGQVLRRKRRRNERICPGERARRKRPRPYFETRRGTRIQAGPIASRGQRDIPLARGRRMNSGNPKGKRAASCFVQNFPPLHNPQRNPLNWNRFDPCEHLGALKLLPLKAE